MSKEIKPLSQAFLEAFNTKASRLKTEIAEKTEVKKIQEEIDSVNRKLSSARQGGFGDIKKLTEEKARLHKKLEEVMDPVNAKALKGKYSDRKDKDIDNDGDVDSSDEYLHNRRKAIGTAMKKEEADLDEAVNVKGIQKAVDDGKSMDVIVGMFANKRTTNTDEIRKVVQDYMWKKRMKKEDVEITELHMSLLEAHGIEKKVAERVKKVFDTMSTEDKAAFMKAYLKNPKAATDHMFSSMKKMTEGVELDEVSNAVKDQLGNIDLSIRDWEKRWKNKSAGNPNDMKAPQKIQDLKAQKAALMKKHGIKEEVELDEGYRLVMMTKDGETMKSKVYSNKKEAESAKWDAIQKDKKQSSNRQYKSIEIVKEEVELDEAKNDYTINHKTFSAAVQHAKSQVEKQGYTIDDDEWDRKVAMGPKKPGTGKTNRYTIALMKGGKETKRNLQMQVYYDEGRYELNMYVS